MAIFRVKSQNKKASKKNVKLGLLAEVRGGEGSEWVLGAQPVIRSVF